MNEATERMRSRTWMLGTGVLLVLVGFLFLLLPLFATLVAGIAAGALLLVAGVAQVVDGIGHHDRGRGWAIALGVIAAVAGGLLLWDPVGGMVGFTVLLAGYLLASGALRLARAGLWSPLPGWGWMLFNGAVSLVLAILVITGWPETGLWTVGIFLGVDALLGGFSRLARALGSAPTEVRA